MEVPEATARAILKGEVFTHSPHIVSFMPAHSSFIHFLQSLHTLNADSFGATLKRFGMFVDVLINVKATEAFQELTGVWRSREDGGADSDNILGDVGRPAHP